QLRAGLSPEEITMQLRAAKWNEAAIESAFAAAREELKPSPETPINPLITNQGSNVSQAMSAILQENTPNDSIPAHTYMVASTESATAVVLPPPSGRGAFKTGLK